jgi:peptidoglycan/xylan/chitin deacetylase (PgdA/CDA1 family)
MSQILTRNMVNFLCNVAGKNSLSVLTYHRVGESYNQLFMNEALFEQQLIWLKNYFNPLDLNEGLTKQRHKQLPPRAVAITVDDGYVDSYTTILPLLKKHGLTATFFISTSGLTKGYLWDELISSAVMQLSANVKELTFNNRLYRIDTYNHRLSCLTEILSFIKYQNLEQRAHYIDMLLQQTGQPKLEHQFMSAEQIKSLSDAGMGIGAHTVNHPILSAESPENAEAEMIESKLMLESIVEKKVDYLAYPNGKLNKDFNEQHKILAQKSGFKAAFSTDWGCISNSSSDEFAYKRFTPWDKTESRFNLRLALNFSDRYTRRFS